MDTTPLDRKFAKIGARLKIADHRSRRIPGNVSLNVRTDRKGEFFEIAGELDGEDGVSVLDFEPAERHLLLLIREGHDKRKLLCGHDERHWFVAAIPESAPAGTVRQAKEALKPAEIRLAQARLGVSTRGRNRRKNAAYVRQGEWFFIPAPDVVVHQSLVMRNEPLSRGTGSKPHWAEYCYRSGGQTVYVCSRRPTGLPEAQYKLLLTSTPKAKTWGWRVMRRNPTVFVKGRIRHADHATIILQHWHRVLMNTEQQSKAMRHVAFLD
jgi:hypothetical protein